eukprot:3361905-Pyramimonas_sp.AAC.1
MIKDAPRWSSPRKNAHVRAMPGPRQPKRPSRRLQEGAQTPEWTFRALGPEKPAGGPKRPQRVPQAPRGQKEAPKRPQH